MYCNTKEKDITPERRMKLQGEECNTKEREWRKEFLCEIVDSQWTLSEENNKEKTPN
jgi:hypothetical protein